MSESKKESVQSVQREQHQQPQPPAVVVAEAVVLRPQEVFPGLQPFMDEKGKCWGQFTDPRDGRMFPLDSDPIREYLRGYWYALKGGWPNKGEMELMRHEFVKAALLEHRGKDKEERLDTNGLVLAVLVLLRRHTYSKPGKMLYEWVSGLEALKGDLISICQANDWDYEHWKGGNWFRRTLDGQAWALKENNVALKYPKRVGRMRPVSLSWIDRTKIPPKEDPTNVDPVDLFEETREQD